MAFTEQLLFPVINLRSKGVVLLDGRPEGLAVSLKRKQQTGRVHAGFRVGKDVLDSLEVLEKGLCNSPPQLLVDARPLVEDEPPKLLHDVVPGDLKPPIVLIEDLEAVCV